MSRFDEIEILHIDDVQPSIQKSKRKPAPAAESASPDEASIGAPLPETRLAARWRRALAFVIDISLFVAAGLAMTPLLPERGDFLSLLETEPLAVLSLVGFLALISFYYFFGAWLIWGKTVGGAILDVRVVSVSGEPLDAISVARRWFVTMLSLFTGLVLFLPALFPARRSVADRMSGTVCVSC